MRAELSHHGRRRRAELERRSHKEAAHAAEIYTRKEVFEIDVEDVACPDMNLSVA